MEILIADLTVEDVLIIIGVCLSIFTGFGHGLNSGKGIAK